MQKILHIPYYHQTGFGECVVAGCVQACAHSCVQEVDCTDPVASCSDPVAACGDPVAACTDPEAASMDPVAACTDPETETDPEAASKDP